MKRHRKNGVPLPLKFIADREQRIVKQKQLIAGLKRKGRSTEQAEAELRRDVLALAMLRNHFDICLALAKPDPYEMRLGEPSAQRPALARNRAG